MSPTSKASSIPTVLSLSVASAPSSLVRINKPSFFFSIILTVQSDLCVTFCVSAICIVAWEQRQVLGVHSRNLSISELGDWSVSGECSRWWVLFSLLVALPIQKPMRFQEQRWSLVKIPAFIEREREYRFLAVMPETLDGKPLTSSTSPAVLCASYSDEEFFQNRCNEGKEIYFQQYGEYEIHKIWRDDILPCRVYLRHCLMAAKTLGDEAYDNFLDHSFLGDRKTTIQNYLETSGFDIMEEEPPESLKVRYGGCFQLGTKTM
ncbi:uncharacterized protein LOC107433283 isoform X4 [Ziziphus jujuba]|uniref:Uncharacterized protein LOC107433283 isoform X4 n=1 Tax=Ziziphus jujuba TaxID=326968 RepID=A0ABM3I759_ZIZJJ|nr:uncharacterized protein LOC107433283 isoform X4 [Ziziphus jujuba]